jgi:transposase-like protein
MSVSPTTLIVMKIKLHCPSCQSGEVKEIIYGLPDPENFDFQKYEVGGCCVTPEDEKYKCSKCEYSW